LDSLDDWADEEELSSFDEGINDEDEVKKTSLVEDNRLAYSTSVALSSVHATIRNSMLRKPQSTIFFIQPPL
jgi:hypothetical protein